MIISRRRRSVWPRPSRAKFLSLTQSVIHLRRRPRQDDHRHWSDDVKITNDRHTPHHDQRNRCRNHFRRCATVWENPIQAHRRNLSGTSPGKIHSSGLFGSIFTCLGQKKLSKKKQISQNASLTFTMEMFRTYIHDKEVKGFKQKCGLDSHIKWSVWSLLHSSW